MTNLEEYLLEEKTRWSGRADEHVAWKYWLSVIRMMTAGEWMRLALPGRKENGL